MLQDSSSFMALCKNEIKLQTENAFRQEPIRLLFLVNKYPGNYLNLLQLKRKSHQLLRI